MLKAYTWLFWILGVFTDPQTLEETEKGWKRQSECNSRCPCHLLSCAYAYVLQACVVYTTHSSPDVSAMKWFAHHIFTVVYAHAYIRPKTCQYTYIYIYVLYTVICCNYIIHSLFCLLNYALLIFGWFILYDAHDLLWPIGMLYEWLVSADSLWFLWVPHCIHCRFVRFESSRWSLARPEIAFSPLGGAVEPQVDPVDSIFWKCFLFFADWNMFLYVLVLSIIVL